MSRIILENVTARFGNTTAVDNLSLEIPDASFFGLLGPSGCGKTTTMRLIAGLEKPVSGRIIIGERVVNDCSKNIHVPPSQRKLGMVFQNYALWPHMTVKDNILFGLKVRHVKESERNVRYQHVMSRLQIEELGERFPNELSGGQQQRIALARELIAGSSVLLMDEPLSNLDAKLRVDMRVELKQLHKETGGTIIYVTHDQIEALTLSSMMTVMREGVLQQVAPPNEVFTRPANYFVASFMASAPVNRLRVRMQDGFLIGEGIRLPAPAAVQPTESRDLFAVARPEEIRIAEEPNEWSITGTISSILPMGYAQLVRIEVSDAQHLIAEHDQRTSTLELGSQVHACFDPKTLHIFDAETEERVGI